MADADLAEQFNVILGKHKVCASQFWEGKPEPSPSADTTPFHARGGRKD
jgi:hypothetical protein